MLKKCFPAALCVILMLSVLLSGISVSAQAKVPFTLSVSEGAVGDTVTVSVSLPENSRFTNATMYLHYNTSALTYIEESVYAGKISPKSNTMYMAKDYAAEGYVKCVYATGGVVKKEGVLLNFEFEVLKNDPASFYLSFDECCGANDDDSLFDMEYEVIGCVLNNDGTVSVPTGIPAISTTVAEPTVTATPSDPTSDSTVTTTVAVVPTTTILFENLPTTVVRDENNNEIIIPIGSTTDAQGNVATVPVATATDAQGNNVTVPVTIVTNEAGAVVTTPDGGVQTTPVTTTTDMELTDTATTLPTGQTLPSSAEGSADLINMPTWLAGLAGIIGAGGLVLLAVVLGIVLLIVAALVVIAIIVRKSKSKKQQ